MNSKQWAKDLPAEVRDVLDAGASMSAPNGAKQAVWSALATKLPVATVAATAGGLTALSIVKPLLVGLVVGALATAGVLELRSKTAPASRSFARASATTSIPAPVQARPSELAPSPLNEPGALDPLAPQPSSKSAPPATPAEGAPPVTARDMPLGQNAQLSGTSSIAAFPDQASAALHEDATVLESRRLNQARAMLQAGDARRALAQLDSIAVDFPRGVLAQELDALRIEALLELGERQRARELARRFLARHPQSPHVAAVERALQ